MFRREVEKGNRLRLLVIRHYKGGPVSFPKGHVEAGETEMETARREVFEETAVISGEFFPDFRETIRYSPTKGVEKDVVYFLALTEDSTVLPRKGEIAEAFWVDAEDAEGVLEHENDRCVLRHALCYIAEKTPAGV